MPESFLEIEVRNPQTHGEYTVCLHERLCAEMPCRLRAQDVYRLRDSVQGASTAC